MDNLIQQSVIKKISIFPALFILLSIALLHSCKKEYTDVYETVYTDTVEVQGFNNIVSFAVPEPETDDMTYAAVKGDSILVYWPVWKAKPETISPEIALPIKASISPESGESVPFGDEVVYTVTSESGEQRIYTLKVTDQQPPFYFYQTGNNSVILGSTIYLNGDGFFGGLNTQVFLEEADGTRVYELPIPTFAVSTNTYSTTIPNTVDTALYRIKMVHGTRSGYVSDLFNGYDTLQVGYSPMNVARLNARLDVKRGETFTLSGSNIRFLQENTAIMYSTFESPIVYRPLVIESYTLTSITFRIPEDTPAGRYNYWGVKTIVAPVNGRIEEGFGSGTRNIYVTE